MSCSTLDQQSTRLSVSAGALPEGFCPESMQDLFNAMAARLIVTPSANFNGIAMGSIEPSGNVGLWLKDCEELFIFDDATARYVPITKGGFNNMEYKSASGSFIVPEFIYKLKVSVWGAGGGGSGQFGAGVPGSGGGAGALATGILTVIPGQTINFTVGLGGAGGPSIGGAGTDGGDTTFMTLTGGGGKGAIATAHVAGIGGIATGGTINFGGGYGDAGDNDPGVGGSSPQGGQGGVASYAPVTVAFNGIAPGGGGAGGEHSGTGQQEFGGTGANGGILIEY